MDIRIHPIYPPEEMNNVDWAFDPANPDRLPNQARELLELLKDLSRWRGYAYIRESKIARRLGISISYVEKLVRMLKEAGFIEIEKHRHNYYWVVQYFTDFATRAVEKLRSKTTAPKPEQPKTEQPPSKPTYTQGKASAPAPTLVGANIAMPDLAEVEATAKLAELRRLEEELVAEPELIDPEIKEAVEEAAKEVREAKRYKKPRSIQDYLDLVKKLLAQWQIEAPGKLIGDVAVANWRSW